MKFLNYRVRRHNVFSSSTTLFFMTFILLSTLFVSSTSFGLINLEFSLCPLRFKYRLHAITYSRAGLQENGQQVRQRGDDLPPRLLLSGQLRRGFRGYSGRGKIRNYLELPVFLSLRGARARFLTSGKKRQFKIM